MTTAQANEYSHLIVSGTFLLWGAWMIARGRYPGRVRPTFEDLDFTDPIPADAQRRVDEAAARRQTAEGAPAPIGVWRGAMVIACGLLAAFPWSNAAILYALASLGFAAISASVFLHYRNLQPVRVAVLQQREPQSVISLWWFALAFLAAFAPLSFITGPDGAAAVVVTISTLVTLAITWRMTQLRAIVPGDDVEAEQFVDDRLRYSRSCASMIFTLVQPAYFSIYSFFRSDTDFLTTLNWVALVATPAIWVAFTVWFFRRQNRPVRLA